MVKVAYWINGLGEECSSQVFAEFTTPAPSFAHYVVVRDWRADGLIVLDREGDNVTVRMESPR